MSDPNWFYSTLAQSSAAVVGLAGGFMVSRILAQRSEISDDRKRAHEAFVGLLEAISARAKNAREIRAAVDSELPAIQETHRIQQSSRLKSFTHTNINASSDLAIEGIELKLLVQLRDDAAMVHHAFQPLAKKPRSLSRRLRTRIGLARVGEPWLRDRRTGSHEGGNFLQALHYQREWLRDDFATLERHVHDVERSVSELQARISLPTLYGLLTVIAAFLVGGVVAPFFFLSGRHDSSRAWLLGIFIALAVLFIVYLFSEIRRLSHALDLDREWY